MATIPFVDTFDCQAPFPLDLRSVKLNDTQRDAIPNNARYDGMEVWVVNDQKKYRLEGGTANENWVEVTTGGGGSGTLQDVTFSSTAPTTQGNDGDIWFRPNNDTIELYYKVSGIWGMVGSWSNLELGETSDTAYRGDRGKIAYDHSQITSGNPHGTTAADVGAVDKSGDTMTGTLQLTEGNTTVAPLIIPEGDLLTIPVDGAIERDEDGVYITEGATRKRIATDETPIITISANTTLSNTHYNAILRITDNCTITVPTTLRSDFNCVFDVAGTFTATFAAGSGATISAPFGLVLKNNAMCTLYKYTSTAYRLNGGLTNA